MKNRLLPVFLIILAFPFKAHSAGLTLEASVERGLKEDNTLKEEAARVSGARAGLTQAKMARFGAFKLKSMYTDGTDPVYAFATAMKQGAFSMASLSTINDPEPARNYMAGIEAGVPLFTGFAVSNGIKMGKMREEAAKNGYERARAGITFKITYQWLNVLLLTKLDALSAEAVTSAEAELENAMMLKEKGMVPGSDYYGAEAILSTLKGYRLSWEKTLELEKEKLALILGMDPSELPEADGTLAETAYREKTFEELLAAISGGRLDIKALKKMADISKTAMAIQENSLLPSVEAFGSWETNSESLSDFRSNRLVGLRLTMPLGDPAYFAKKNAAKAETSMAKSRLAEANKQANIEAAEALNNYRTAKESLPIAKKTLEKARLSLKLFLPLYRQGRQSVLEALRAQASALQAEAAYYENIYKLHLYHARLLLAAEQMNADTVAEMSSVLSSVPGR